MSNKVKATLPPIPDRLYFTIGETSQLCDVKPHVLRYWEQEFSQLKPTKRRGGRRSYQQKDISMIRTIRELLYYRGFTISGAKQQLHQGGDKNVLAAAPVVSEAPPVVAPTIAPKLEMVASVKEEARPAATSAISNVHVTQLIDELQNLLDTLKKR